MTVRRTRSALVAMLLALFAVLTMSAVSGWHGATVHADDILYAPSVLPVVTDTGLDGDRSDPGDTVHVGAHAIGHGVGIPAPARPSAPWPLATMVWTMVIDVIGRGLDPASLLRPPRD